MIPDFPQFKKLEIEDRVAINAITKRYPPYSDFNFSSLWVWDTEEKRGVSMLNGNLVVRFTDYTTLEPFLSFLGSNEEENTIRELIEFSKTVGLVPRLKLVPHVSVHKVESNDFLITPDVDNFDYVYLTSLIATTAGGQYKGKRKSAARFQRLNAHTEFKILPFNNPDIPEQMVTVLRAWESHKKEHKKEYDLEHEEKAIRRAFQLANEESYVVGAVYNDGVMIAFTIEELVDNKYAMGHFWKADARFDGVYDFLACHTAKYLNEQGIPYWNWEQDLGIAHLRASKSSYRPSDFLKKFTIEEKSAPGE